jgi:hypothetical protein
LITAISIACPGIPKHRLSHGDERPNRKINSNEIADCNFAAR